MTSDGRADRTHDRKCYALILLSTFASSRRGEATALRRCDLDLDAHVRVRPAYAERSTGGMLPGPPKSKPGRRIAGTPDAIIAALREHLSVFVKDGYGARPAGGQPALRRSAHKHQISPLRAPEAATAAAASATGTAPLLRLLAGAMLGAVSGVMAGLIAAVVSRRLAP